MNEKSPWVWVANVFMLLTLAIFLGAGGPPFIQVVNELLSEFLGVDFVINVDAVSHITGAFSVLLVIIATVIAFYESSIAPFVRRRRVLAAWRKGADPYVVGDVVEEPARFYGREEALTELLRALEAGNHVALYGERRIGKTSLLHQLAHRLRQMTDAPCRYIPAIVSVQMVPEPRFFYALMSATAKAASGHTGSLHLLMNERPDRFDSLDLADDLEVLVAALQRAGRRPPRIVLLLDEADRMNDYDPHTQEALRGLLMTPVGGHVKLVWSGQTMNREWHLESSPWYNLFKREIRLAGLEEEAAVRLVREPVKEVFTYEDEAVQRILEFTDHKPYTIQRICSFCVRRLLVEDRYRVTTDDVEAAWGELQAEDARRAAEGAAGLTYEAGRPAWGVAEEGAEYRANENENEENEL